MKFNGHETGFKVQNKKTAKSCDVLPSYYESLNDKEGPSPEKAEKNKKLHEVETKLATAIQSLGILPGELY